MLRQELKLMPADVLGSAAFKPVKNDMTGNIKAGPPRDRAIWRDTQ
jgi:hypothetical protein